MKAFVILVIAITFLPLQLVSAASKESGSSKAIKKLQMMVQEATTERDRIKADSAKITAELEQVKKDLENEKKAKTQLETKSTATEKRLNDEIAAQKSISDEIRSRLDKTTAKLHEVIDKYNALNQSKNDLASEHSNLQNTQKFTATELKSCETKNMKMFEGTKQVIAGYKRCQDKDWIDVVTDAEPATQITNVGFEKLVQEYEDKIIKQKFYPSPNPNNKK